MSLKFLIGILLISSWMSLSAQNIQLHYDFGENRNHATSTIEMFKPDKLGNTFFFIDMDYNSGDIKGISLSYMEVARVFKTQKMPIGIHAEFNGGMGQFVQDNKQVGYNLNNAWLGGIDYSVNTKDFSKGFSLKVLYKYIKDKHDMSFQLTGVGYINLFNEKVTVKGFVDFWKEDWDFDFDGNTDTEYIFLSEPQIWYNINKSFSVGSEIELSNNFGNVKGFQVNPTAGIKWTIK